MSRSRRILVVDDQPDILELTAAVLEGAGYDVVTVSGADAALDRLERDTPFDLVLLDVNMPGMDGWEALRMIRADERLLRLPVVMFSVRGEMRDRITGLQEGASDWIPKPFQVDELLFRVRRAIVGAGAGA